jgi:hypothetical protein
MLIDHVELDHASKAFLKEGHDLAITINTLLGKIDDLGDVYGDDDSAGRPRRPSTRRGTTSRTTPAPSAPRTPESGTTSTS